MPRDPRPPSLPARRRTRPAAGAGRAYVRGAHRSTPRVTRSRCPSHALSASSGGGELPVVTPPAGSRQDHERRAQERPGLRVGPRRERSSGCPGGRHRPGHQGPDVRAARARLARSRSGRCSTRGRARWPHERAQPQGTLTQVGPVLRRRVPGAPVAKAAGEGTDRAAAEGRELQDAAARATRGKSRERRRARSAGSAACAATPGAASAPAAATPPRPCAARSGRSPTAATAR